MKPAPYIIFLAAAVTLLAAACDTVEPEEPGRLVVEGFVSTGQPLPSLTMRLTQAVATRTLAAEAVTDASVTLTLDGTPVTYEADTTRPGRYVPEDAATSIRPQPGSTFEVEVDWRGRRARASDRLPRPIAIDSIRLNVSGPVEAILVDSLRLDSLDTGAREGFIYPVEVDVFWTTPFAETGADSTYWIRPHLQPEAVVEEFFVRQDQVLRERTLPRSAEGRRRWTGVYAVPVEARETPMPPHRLKVALLRSGPDYARFASSRDTPDRREPLSNVEGALGIVAGVSVDSLVVQVP